MLTYFRIINYYCHNFNETLSDIFKLSMQKNLPYLPESPQLSEYKHNKGWKIFR